MLYPNLPKEVLDSDERIARRMVQAGRILYFALNRRLALFSDIAREDFLRYALTSDHKSSLGVVDPDGEITQLLEHAAQICKSDHIIAFSIYAHNLRHGKFIPGVSTGVDPGSVEGLEYVSDAMVLSRNNGVHERLNEDDQEGGVDRLSLKDTAYGLGFLGAEKSYLAGTNASIFRTLGELSRGESRIARGILGTIETNVNCAIRQMQARFERVGELSDKLKGI